MSSSSDLVNTGDATVGGVWGRIMFFTVMTSAACHGLWDVLAVAKAVRSNPRFLLLPVAYFAIGMIYAFLRCWILALAIAFVHLSLRDGMTVGELGFYVFCLCVVCMFYSAGRIPNLYSM